MTYALLVLVGIMAIVVWWLARQTVNVTPWVEQHGTVPSRGDGSDGSLPLIDIKVGLGVFLAVATSLFALLDQRLSHAHAGRRLDPAARPARALAQHRRARARAASRCTGRAPPRACGSRDGVVHGLVAAGVLSFGFLAGQLWAWQQMDAAGYFVAANPAYAFFYLLTAVHGLHLLGGLFVWARTTYRTCRSADAETDSIERRALHRLLALPARRVGGPVRRAAAFTTTERARFP